MNFFIIVFFLLIFERMSVFMEIKANVIVQNDFAKLVSYDESFVRITNFKFYKKRRNFAALNISYTTLQDVISDEQIKVNVAALQFRGNEYKKTVVDFSLGICTAFKANKFDSMSFIKDSNLSGCPFPKGSYYINDLAPSADMLPPFFPEGKWLLDLTFINHGKTITQVHWMISIIKKL